MLGVYIGQVHSPAAARVFARYKSDLVGVQEVRCDKTGTVRAGGYNFFLWKRKRKP